MKCLFFILITLLISSSFVVSQEAALDKKIKAQLNPADKKNIEKAEQLLEEANAQMGVADETEQVNPKKAYKIRIKASKSLGKANKIFYKVFSRDIEQFFYNIDPLKSKKAGQKVDKARLLMKEAKRSRENSLKLNVPENAYLALKKANKYENSAINNLKQVYGMFIAPDETGEDKKTGKVVKTNTQKEESNKKIVQSDVKKLVPIKIFGTRGVFFLIQVAASRSPISDDYLRKNYKEDIHGELFDEWYRYVINQRFATLGEAEKYKAKAGIRGTLVIAIKNGRKVSIQEAQKKEVTNNTKTAYTPLGNDKKNTNNKQTFSTSSLVYKLEIGDFN